MGPGRLVFPKRDGPEYQGNNVRIVGGAFKGRDLLSPNDFRVRPTAEHVRAGMLDLLAADLANARVLELFAGTGAIGIEALSRGAKTVDFIETRPASLHALRANIASFRLRDRSRIFKRDALQFASLLREGSYEIAIADPPYGSKMLDRVVDMWIETRFSPVLAVEHERGHALPGRALRKSFEDTTVSIYRV